MSKPTRKSFRVRDGNTHITVAPWTHPQSGAQRWRYAYRDLAGGPWRYRVFRTKEAAEVAALEQLRGQQTGTGILDGQSPARLRWLAEIAAAVPEGEERKVLDFLANMTKSADVGESVARFGRSRESKAGEKTPHLRTVQALLEEFAAHFRGRMVMSIQLPELQAWFDSRTDGTGWKRKKDIRAALVQFYRWAKKEGIAGNDAVTVADRLPEIGGQHGERKIMTTDQFVECAQMIGEDFRAWLVLGCFAGLRPEEICPATEKRSIKRGLRCEEIDWDFRVIRIAPEVSKVKLPRIVPMSDALIAWLEWAGIAPGMEGPVCMVEPAKSGELARLGKLVFGGEWPRNACRHSYGSYRNAQIRDLAKVAEEMGSSVTMLHRHYHNPQPQEIGAAWFALRPSVPICSDGIEVAKESTTKKRHKKAL